MLRGRRRTANCATMWLATEPVPPSLIPKVRSTFGEIPTATITADAMTELRYLGEPVKIDYPMVAESRGHRWQALRPKGATH